MRDFKALAELRAMKPVAIECSGEWNAMPTVLKHSIDRFNQLLAAVCEQSLQTMIDQPEVAQALDHALAQRHESIPQRDQGG